MTLARDSGWQQIAAPVWTPSTLDVYFRVSNLATGDWDDVWIDDFQVTCAWRS